MKDRITIEGRDGAFGAYIARPKALPAAAVVVLQELFGVNDDIRKTCDELAEEEDEFISKPAQAEIKTALAGKPNATVYSYPGQHHAFARHNGAHYNAAAAALANSRASEFLHQRLRRPLLQPSGR